MKRIIGIGLKPWKGLELTRKEREETILGAQRERENEKDENKRERER